MQKMLVSVELFQWSAENLYSFIRVLLSNNLTLKLWFSHQSVQYSCLICFMLKSTPAIMQYQNRMFITDKWPYPYIAKLPNVDHIIIWSRRCKQGWATQYKDTSDKYSIPYIYFSLAFIVGSLCLLHNVSPYHWDQRPTSVKTGFHFTKV